MSNLGHDVEAGLLCHAAGYSLCPQARGRGPDRPQNTGPPSMVVSPKTPHRPLVEGQRSRRAGVQVGREYRRVVPLEQGSRTARRQPAPADDGGGRRVCPGTGGAPRGRRPFVGVRIGRAGLGAVSRCGETSPPPPVDLLVGDPEGRSGGVHSATASPSSASRTRRLRG